MPSTSKENYSISARLHPVDENGSPDLGLRFTESQQRLNKAGDKTHVDIGVSTYDKAVCTIDLYQLHLNAHLGLNCIVVETIVDGEQIGCQLYYPHSLVERSNVVVSPMCCLNQEYGKISIRIVADIMWMDGRSHSKDYILHFHYDRSREYLLAPLGSKDRRYQYQPMQEQVYYEKVYKIGDKKRMLATKKQRLRRDGKVSSLGLAERVNKAEESDQGHLASRIAE